jgi:quercetin dioxygenase-like cupin family protein
MTESGRASAGARPCNDQTETRLVTGDDDVTEQNVSAVPEIGSITQPRRVITGEDAKGRPYLARVEAVDEIDYPYCMPPQPAQTAGGPPVNHRSGGSGYFRIWGSDRLPVPLPTDGKTPFFTSRPDADETPQALRRAAALPPPLGVRVGWSTNLRAAPTARRFHWTDSTDVLFVLSGKQGQILDRGEHVMHPGDVLIQNGTMHSHQTIEPTRLGWVMLGGLRVGLQPALERLQPISGPNGGHRSGETQEKERMGPWDAPGPGDRTYPSDPGPRTIEEMVAPRRLITGTDAQGLSYFAHAETCERAPEAARELGISGVAWPVWAIDRLPALHPNDDPHPAPTSSLPGAVGANVAIARLDPTEQAGSTIRRDAMDIVFVMSGCAWLQLDGGDEVELTAGDVLIQNGTAHAWHNRASVPAVIGIAALGAARICSRP